MFTITAITYGVSSVETSSPMGVDLGGSPKIGDRVAENICYEIFQLALDAQKSESLRPIVHRLMRAAAQGDVAFQIHNGDRVLTYTGGEHDKTDFFIGLPGESIDLWSYGK